jgi:hypothetical protein
MALELAPNNNILRNWWNKMSKLTSYERKGWSLGGVVDKEGIIMIDLNAPGHACFGSLLWRFQYETKSIEVEAAAARVVNALNACADVPNHEIINYSVRELIDTNIAGQKEIARLNEGIERLVSQKIDLEAKLKRSNGKIKELEGYNQDLAARAEELKLINTTLLTELDLLKQYNMRLKAGLEEVEGDYADTLLACSEYEKPSELAGKLQDQYDTLLADIAALYRVAELNNESFGYLTILKAIISKATKAQN